MITTAGMVLIVFSLVVVVGSGGGGGGGGGETAEYECWPRQEGANAEKLGFYDHCCYYCLKEYRRRRLSGSRAGHRGES
jgi:hypothetical protein